MPPIQIGPGHYDLAYTLAEARKHLGYSQKEAAQMMGISASTYSQWETGRRVPSTTTLQSLCRVFECAVRIQANGFWLVDLGQIVEP